MKSVLVVLAVVATAFEAVHADEVYLKGGGRVSGVIAEESARSVDVEIGAGLVSVPRSQVDRIVRSASPLATYQMRAHALSPNDVSGWSALAAWAQRSELSTQAREAYARVLEIDPSNAAAQRALGNQLIGDRWLNRDDAMQAQGYVRYEGEWVTLAERESLIADRASAHREGLELARSRAAVAEAEARAREAEARARAVEAEADRAAIEADAVAVPVIAVPYGGYGYGTYANTRHGYEGGRQHESCATGHETRPTTEARAPRRRERRDSTPPPAASVSAARASSFPSSGGMSVAGYRLEKQLDADKAP